MYAASSNTQTTRSMDGSAQALQGTRANAVSPAAETAANAGAKDGGAKLYTREVLLSARSNRNLQTSRCLETLTCPKRI